MNPVWNRVSSVEHSMIIRFFLPIVPSSFNLWLPSAAASVLYLSLLLFPSFLSSYFSRWILRLPSQVRARTESSRCPSVGWPKCHGACCRRLWSAAGCRSPSTRFKPWTWPCATWPLWGTGKPSSLLNPAAQTQTNVPTRCPLSLTRKRLESCGVFLPDDIITVQPSKV